MPFVIEPRVLKLISNYKLLVKLVDACQCELFTFKHILIGIKITIICNGVWVSCCHSQLQQDNLHFRVVVVCSEVLLLRLKGVDGGHFLSFS